MNFSSMVNDCITNNESQICYIKKQKLSFMKATSDHRLEKWSSPNICEWVLV